MDTARHRYQQLKEYLLEEIDKGRLQAGARVPSERELAARFHVSRMTVRHALAELANQGILYRSQGRGTFVARPKIRQPLMGLTSFTEDMLQRGLRPGAKVLSVQAIPAPYRVRQALGLQPDQPVLRVERLRLANEEPMALEITHLPLHRFPGMEQANLENASLYALLAERYGVHVHTATQTIEPAVADTALALALGIAEGTSLLLLERATFDTRGEPVEFATSYYRGDRYRFVVELHRG